MALKQDKDVINRVLKEELSKKHAFCNCVALPYFVWVYSALLYSAWQTVLHVTPRVPCVAFDRERIKQQFDITYTTIAAYGAWFALGVHLFA